MTKLDKAAETWYLRNVKYRYHIPGVVVWSTGTRCKPKWFPIPSEVQDCCKKIKLPSSIFPYSLLDHCRTIKHIAEMFDVSILKLRQKVKARKVEAVLLGKLPRRSTYTGPR